MVAQAPVQTVAQNPVEKVSQGQVQKVPEPTVDRVGRSVMAQNPARPALSVLP